MRKNFFLKISFTAFLFLSACVNSFSQADKAEEDIKDIMKELKVVGLSVVVVKKGAILPNGFTIG